MAKKVVKKAAGVNKAALQDECPQHDRHLCHILNLRNMKTAGRLAKNAQYICFVCGRAAKKAENLCQPEQI